MASHNRKTADMDLIRAFLAFEGTQWGELQSDHSHNQRRKYAASIKGFTEEGNMDFSFVEPIPANDQKFEEFFKEFSHYVTHYKAKLHARLVILNKEENKESSDITIVLSDNYRTEIHERLNQIRKIVNVMDLPIDKRDLIFDRISDLGREIDRERTPLGTTLAKILDITNAAGEATENLDPLFKKINSLYKLFSKAKAESDLNLIESNDTKQLAAPEQDD